jgi:hypothetical protein
MLVLAALLSLAAPGSAAPAVPEAPAALVDRFIAALPPDPPRTSADILGKQQIARLEALNPGREAALHTILDRFVACETPVVYAATIRMLRKIAASFGERRLAKLTLFYEKKEQVRFERLGSADARGEKLSAADRAELKRMLTDYPLMDWFDAMGHMKEIAMEDQAFLAAVTRCSLQKKRELADAGLRV